MAELFVGRELQDYDYEAIARALVQTGLAASEIEHALWEEVAPALGCNLSWLNSAPEMEGWRPEQVNERIRYSLGKGPPGLAGRWMRRLLDASQRELILDRWNRVKAQMTPASP